jgi:small conductance mechanosensitive channel
MKLHESYHVFVEKTENWLNKVIDHLPNMLLALVVIFLFYLAARFLRNMGYLLMAKHKHDASLVDLFSRFLSFLVFVMGVFISLKVLGLDTAISSLLAGAGIIGLALGFAFQDLTANFISGIFIVAGEPIRTGDMVETNGYTGKVVQIKVRSAIIENFDGQLVEIPSRKIIENPIINYTKLGVRRLQVNCQVAYGTDLDKVERITLQAVEALQLHHVHKKVEVHFSAFENSGIALKVLCWIDLQDENHPGILVNTSQVIKAIHPAYAENGIQIPYPTSTIYLEKEK